MRTLWEEGVGGGAVCFERRQKEEGLVGACSKVEVAGHWAGCWWRIDNDVSRLFVQISAWFLFHVIGTVHVCAVKADRVY
jgi:hypothetical protein